MEAIDDKLVVGGEVSDVVGTVVACMFGSGIGESFFDLVDGTEIRLEVCLCFVCSGLKFPIDEFFFFQTLHLSTSVGWWP